MRVHAKPMTSTGLRDFGGTATASNDIAEHKLVFIFHSFGDHYQPFVAFASPGLTTGTILAQLISKAIFLLKKAGDFVDVIVCDGASTNRFIWKAFGVEHCRIPSTFSSILLLISGTFVFPEAPHPI